MAKQIMTATIEHTAKTAYRVRYAVASEELTGAGWTYAVTQEAAKARFEKSGRAKKYQVEWES